MGYLIAETRMDFSDEGPRQGRRRKLRVGPEIRKHLESLDCQVKQSSNSGGRWVRGKACAHSFRMSQAVGKVWVTPAEFASRAFSVLAA